MVLVTRELAARLAIVNPAHLPTASKIVVTVLRLLADPDFLVHVAATLVAWAVGLAAATVIAVPLGLLLGSSSRSYRAAVAAIEVAWPRAVAGGGAPSPPRWRFAGRWWSKPVPARRERPW